MQGIIALWGGGKVSGRTVGDQSSDVFRCSTDHGDGDGLIVSCARGTLAW